MNVLTKVTLVNRDRFYSNKLRVSLRESIQYLICIQENNRAK